MVYALPIHLNLVKLSVLCTEICDGSHCHHQKSLMGPSMSATVTTDVTDVSFAHVDMCYIGLPELLYANEGESSLPSALSHCYV